MKKNLSFMRPMGFKDYRTVGTSISKTELEQKHGIGFIKRDALSQTDLSEIYDLKEAQSCIEELLGEIAFLRKDLLDSANTMKQRYDERVEETATRLYETLVERETEIKRIHEEKTESLKHTFRQELADAIVKLSVDFQKNIDFNISKVRAKRVTERTQKYKLLQAAVHRDECIIHALRTQLKRLHEKFIFDSNDDDDELLNEALKPSDEEKNIEQEVEMMRDKIPYMKRRVNNLQENLEDQLSHTAKLQKKHNVVKEKLHIHQDMSRLLREEQDEIRDILDIKKASVQMSLNKKKVEWDKVIEEKVEEAKQEMIEQARQNGLDIQMSAKEQERLLMNEIHLLNEKIVKQIQRRKNKSKEESDIEDIILANHQRMEEIDRLRKELVRIRETWEYKYVFLQFSKNEIKEEMFVERKKREPLANLNRAFISYGNQYPIGINSRKSPFRDSGVPSRMPPISARVKIMSHPGNKLGAIDFKFIRKLWSEKRSSPPKVDSFCGEGNHHNDKCSVESVDYLPSSKMVHQETESEPREDLPDSSRSKSA